MKSSADISTQTAREARRKQGMHQGKVAARTVQQGCQRLRWQGKELCRAATASLQHVPGSLVWNTALAHCTPMLHVLENSTLITAATYRALTHCVWPTGSQAPCHDCCCLHLCHILAPLVQQTRACRADKLQKTSADTAVTIVCCVYPLSHCTATHTMLPGHQALPVHCRHLWSLT